MLRRPRFKFEEHEVQAVLLKFSLDGLRLEAGSQPDLKLPDPDDVPFLEAALWGHADYLVTGNLADYPKANCREVQVVNPAQFMGIWRSRDR